MSNASSRSFTPPNRILPGRPRFLPRYPNSTGGARRNVQPWHWGSGRPHLWVAMRRRLRQCPTAEVKGGDPNATTGFSDFTIRKRSSAHSRAISSSGRLRGGPNPGWKGVVVPPCWLKGLPLNFSTNRRKVFCVDCDIILAYGVATGGVKPLNSVRAARVCEH
jgi:hypothetical protein